MPNKVDKNELLKDITEANAQNETLQKYVIDYIIKQFPVEGKTNTLELKEISLDASKIDPMDLPLQKDIKLKGGTWALPIYGSLVLRNNKTGEVIDESKKTRLLNLPIVTNRYSMIIDGSEYQTINQLRLKSGIYTRVKENGDLESWFDLEKGYNFKMIFDPETKLFYLVLANRKFKVYPILKALGFPDEDIKRAWGKEIYEENQRLGLNKDLKEIPDLVEKLTKKRPANYEEAMKGLIDYLDYTKVDKETTKLTLGESFEKVSAETLFATSKKILGILRGTEKPDERDSLVFKNIYTPASLLGAFMDKKVPAIEASLKYRTDSKTQIKDIISSDTYTKPFKSFYTTGDLSSTPEQTNPISILNEWRKTTVMGTGGVKSDHAITLGVRDVHPSHFGFLDALGSPESGRVGVTLPLAVDVVSTDDNILRKQVVLSSGKKKYITPTEAANLAIAFPDQWVWKDGKPASKHSKVNVMRNGEVVAVPPKEVDVWIENSWSLWSWPTNLVPFLPNDDAVRASFGSKMTSQAIALDKQESPNVESRIGGGKLGDITFEQAIGKYLSPIVPYELKKGTVTKITDDYVFIKPDGQKTEDKIGLFNNFPLNRETFLHSVPKVKVGDEVRAGDILAHLNFQDPKTDGLAYGLNVNVAYMPWKGMNYEDSCVITESLAKEMTSTKIITESLLVGKEGILNLKKFRVYFPGIIDDKAADILDEEGIVKVGSWVEPNQIIMAYMEKKDLTDSERILRSMNKSMYVPYANRSVSWHGANKAKVIYVNRLSGGKIVAHLKESSPMVVGDKLAGRHGNKSIVSRIIPDDEAPHTIDGKRIDLILSPNGVPGRMNAGQLLETAAGKIANSTGKKYLIDNFDGENHLKDIQAKLKEHGLKDKDILLDGKDGKPFLNPVFNGNQYILKLMHTVDHKSKSRSYGSYSIEEQPSRGDEGGQKVDPLSTFALLAHGARENLREFAAVKSQKNDEIWAAIQTGQPIPPPRSNFAFEKLLVQLQGAGINVTKKGNTMTMEPMIDSEILAMSNGKITDAGKMLIGKNLDAIKGGIFDKDILGGVKGKKWGHIELEERMPNPLYQKPIMVILGLTDPQFKRVLAGEEKLSNGLTGPKGIEKMLHDLDVEGEFEKAKKDLVSAPRNGVNRLNQRVRYLEAIKRFNKNPADLYMLKYVPVMPPIYRPIMALGSGDTNVAPINHNYRFLALASNDLKHYKSIGVEKEFGPKARLALYEELSNTIGLSQSGRPDIARKTEGIVMSIAGKNTPKFGYAHNKLWGKRQDLSGRSTITLDPSLGLDEVGLPANIYKKVFLPFAVREMVNQGLTPLEARQQVIDDSPLAQNAFEIAMKNRPVLMNRAPSLHKHSVQAHIAKPTSGASIKLNPLIVTGYNADFDGDTMSVHVPISGPAVEEAYTMLPSRNIWQAGSKANVPASAFSKDYMLGLWQLTKEEAASSYSFKTLAEANAAYKADKIKMNHTFLLNGHRTSLGRQLVIRVLPKSMQATYDKVITKKDVRVLLDEIAKNNPNDFSSTIDALKDIALQFGHSYASTISLEDLDIDRSFRDKILIEYKKKEDPSWNTLEKANHWLKAQGEIVTAQNDYIKRTGKARGFFDMLDSGSESKQDSVRQIITMPGVKIDVYGKPLAQPIIHSYAEGLNQGEYWMSLYGARKGMVDRSINTEQSGAINKSLLGVTKSLLVVEADCGTTEGVEIEAGDTMNLMDRYVAIDIPGIAKAGELVNGTIISKVKNKKLASIWVRSPLTCETPHGICQKCYGIAEDGNLVAIGTNVGVKAGQSTTERATQLTLKSFHSGGSAAAEQDAVAGFPRMEQLLKVPEILSNKATLASIRGTVHRIEKSAIGGHDIYISGVKHHVPYGRTILVKSGDEVQEGDSLSSGAIKPQELATYKGYQAARLQMVRDLEGVFGKEGLGKRTFETVLRGIANQATIDEAPGDTEYYRGDNATLSKVLAENKERKLKGQEEIKFTPYFKSIDTLALDNPDWLSKLTVNRIKETLKDGAALGAASNLHGTDPMPSYLYGTEFNTNVDYGKGRFY